MTSILSKGVSLCLRNGARSNAAKILHITTPLYKPRRHLMMYLNYIVNRVNRIRVVTVGPDAACAEWIMRLGGRIKFEGDKEYTENYNDLESIQENENGPEYIPGSQKLIEIDASGTSIMWCGFPHLEGTSVRKMIIDNCKYVDDRCLVDLNERLQHLEDLQISNCPKVTTVSLVQLKDCKNLRYLKVFNLPKVKKMNLTLEMLRHHLPKCNISHTDGKHQTVYTR